MAPREERLADWTCPPPLSCDLHRRRPERVGRRDVCPHPGERADHAAVHGVRGAPVREGELAPSHDRSRPSLTPVLARSPSAQGPPRIVRLFGKGTAHLRGSDEYRRRIPAGDERPGSRAVISVAIEKVGSSCGYSIPYFAYVKERDTLDRWAARKEGHTNLSEPTFADDEDLRAYWIKRTSTSIDGLPGIGQQWDPSVPAPTPAATKACATAPKPTPSWASRLPLAASHVAAAAAGAGLVHAHHEGLVDLKLVAGLATATVAWVVGQAVGAPVPAPCCAMGL